MRFKMDKNMRAGYQGKFDSMRAMADKLFSRDKSSKDTSDKKVRLFKEGGMVSGKGEVIRDLKRDMRAENDVRHNDYELRKALIEDGNKEYRKGGVVKASSKDCGKKDTKMQKFAAGGVAKIRHNQATPKGAQKGTKKTNLKNTVY